MTNRFPCDDKQRLIAYLYGEVSDADRATFDAHLATCAACAAEVADLRAVRVDLAAWQPPDAELGFRIVREPEAAPPRRWWQVPGWAPVALAAGLLLALAASVEVEYGNGAVVIRSGWMKPAPVTSAAGSRTLSPAPAPAAAPVSNTRAAATMSEADVRAALASLESRLRAEMATVRTAAPVPAPSEPGIDRAGVVRHVENLIEASERRQQRELAFRLAQAMQDIDTQRRSDLVRIENGLGQIEGLTVQEGARQNRLINYLMRTSQQER
jgi:anti-sigma factor RsiW